MNEGSGIRARRPNANSVRAFVLAEFAARPGCILTRDEIAAISRSNLKGADNAVRLLKRDGLLCTFAGPGHTKGYQWTGKSAPAPRPPRPKPEVAAIRKWPEGSYFVEPRPIVNSIFNLANTL